MWRDIFYPIHLIPPRYNIVEAYQLYVPTFLRKKDCIPQSFFQCISVRIVFHASVTGMLHQLPQA